MEIQNDFNYIKHDSGLVKGFDLLGKSMNIRRSLNLIESSIDMKKGFTLIELLIVIAIIGILAGVILVSTSGARIKAQEQAARSTMRSALTYMVMCVGGGANVTAYSAGGNICSDPLASDAKWPAQPAGCTTAFASSANKLTATCGTVAISCDAALGSCI